MIRRRHADMIMTGAAVRVRDARPGLDGAAHVRMPHYLRGRNGIVLRCLDTFPNSEDLAFDRPAAVLPQRPAGTETLSEVTLSTLIDAGDMIGVTRPPARPRRQGATP